MTIFVRMMCIQMEIHTHYRVRYALGKGLHGRVMPRTRTCRDSQQADCRTARPVRWRRRGRCGDGDASRTNVWACRLWCFCDSPFSAGPLRRFDIESGEAEGAFAGEANQVPVNE